MYFLANSLYSWVVWRETLFNYFAMFPDRYTPSWCPWLCVMVDWAVGHHFGGFPSRELRCALGTLPFPLRLSWRGRSGGCLHCASTPRIQGPACDVEMTSWRRVPLFQSGRLLVGKFGAICRAGYFRLGTAFSPSQPSCVTLADTHWTPGTIFTLHPVWNSWIFVERCLPLQHHQSGHTGTLAIFR